MNKYTNIYQNMQKYTKIYKHIPKLYQNIQNTKHTKNTPEYTKKQSKIQ